MRLLTVPLLLLAGALGWYVVEGGAALENARAGARELARRSEDLAAALATAGPVSYAGVDHLEAEGGRLEQRWQSWRTLLLVPEDRPPGPTLEATLDALSTGPNGARVDDLRLQAGASPEAKALVARLLAVLRSSGVPELNLLEVAGGGQRTGMEDVPGLDRLDARVSVAGDLSQVLDFLEGLVPELGQGEPVLWLKQATVQRIEPGRWGDSLQHLDGPPVRLTASVRGLFASSDASAGEQ